MFIRLLSNKKAFSLFEIIVAVALFSIIIAGFIEAYKSSISLAVNNQRKIEALSEAQTILEEIRAARDKNWDGESSINDWLVKSGWDMSSLEKNDDKYDRKITTTNNYISTSNLVKIDLEIKYYDKFTNQKFKTVKLTTEIIE